MLDFLSVAASGIGSNPDLADSLANAWSTFVSSEGLNLYLSVYVVLSFICGFLFCAVFVFVFDLCDIVHAAVPLVRRSINERKAKKSGKLTNKQRLELLESKIDSLADIVISSSSEEK